MHDMYNVYMMFISLWHELLRESQLQSTIKYSLVICWSNCIDAVNVLLYSTREKTKNLIDLLATGQLVAFIHTHLSKLVT